MPKHFAASKKKGSISHMCYMGREQFVAIWEVYLEMKDLTQYRQSVHLYGTSGYGTSHILVALACLLVRTGQRMVYLPDCRVAVHQPLRCLKNALFFAFGDSKSSAYRERISRCDTFDKLENFCEQYRVEGQLCFVVDQTDALMHSWDDQRLHRGLQRMWQQHIQVTSISANNQTTRHMAAKQTEDSKIPLLGGMTPMEMSHWWRHNAARFTAFSQAEKERIEDLTGCIPLLLTPFLGHQGESLESLEPLIWEEEPLKSVCINTETFAIDQKRPNTYDEYVSIMRSCLTNTHIDRVLDLMDYHYFYIDEEYRGYYTCGLTRQTMIEFLREQSEEDVFLGPKWLLALEAFKHNSSVIGFIVEEIIISKIACSGLTLDGVGIPKVKITPFTAGRPALSTVHESAFYVPLRFNKKAIDAIFVAINPEKFTAKVTAIQITVGKRPEDSEAKFFADRAWWVEKLKDFEVTSTFLWIVENKRGEEEVMEAVKNLRNKDVLLPPRHTTRWVSVEQIDTELATTLRRIRPKYWATAGEQGHGGRSQWPHGSQVRGAKKRRRQS